MNKIYALYHKFISRSRFQLLGALLLWACDVLTILYVNSVLFKSKKMDIAFANALAMQGINVNEMSAEHLMEFKGVFFSTMMIFFFLFLCNNTFFYIMFGRGKKSGFKFVKGYVYFSSFLSIWNLFQPGTNSVGWILLLVGSCLAYIWAFFGIRAFNADFQNLFLEKIQEQ